MTSAEGQTPPPSKGPFSFRRRPEDQTRFRRDALLAQDDPGDVGRGRRFRRFAFITLPLVLFAGTALAYFAPALTDQFGYEEFYSRTEHDGRRFILERKLAPWLPGQEFRCVVLESNGERTTYAVSAESECEPEVRIQTALLGEVSEACSSTSCCPEEPSVPEN